MPDIQAQLPAGIKIGIPYDSTLYIQDAIDEVLKTLAETLLIVVVVIFLFLGSFRSVLIPVVAIPISLVGAVFLMLIAGFTINLLTLLAIVLAVGLVVDDAIVMVENIERHIHEGKKPLDAAIQGARELVGPIIAMTITLAAVYTPVGIQGGLTGALFREFAFALAGAVIVSGVVALTLSPMMGSRLLRSGDSERGFAGWVNHRFERVRARYTQPAVRARSRIGPSSSPLGDRGPPGRALLHVLAAGARPARGPGHRVRLRPGFGQLDPGPDEAFRRRDREGLPVVPRNGKHVPGHLPDRRLQRPGHEALERAQADDAAAGARGLGQAVGDRRRAGHPADAAAPARGR